MGHAFYSNIGLDADMFYINQSSAGTWGSRETVDSDIADGSNHPGISIDSEGIAHISYVDFKGAVHNLTYANRTGNAWSDVVVDSNLGAGGSILDSGIEIDSNNNPVIVYSIDNQTDDAIKYAYFDNSWNTRHIFTQGDAITMESEIFIDSNDAVYLIFHNHSNIHYTTNGIDSKNVTLDISNDGDVEFNATDIFTTKNITTDFSSEITTFLSTCTADSSGFCDLPINLSGEDGRVTLDTLNITFTEFPRVNVTYPINGTVYDFSQVALNYTAFDSNLNTCWYSLDDGETNVTITCGENVTGLDSGEGNFNWTVYANDTDNSVNSSAVTFSVALTPPVVTLDSPPNNTFFSSNLKIYLNYTGTDANGLTNCSIFHNP